MLTNSSWSCSLWVFSWGPNRPFEKGCLSKKACAACRRTTHFCSINILILHNATNPEAYISAAFISLQHTCLIYLRHWFVFFLFGSDIHFFYSCKLVDISLIMPHLHFNYIYWNILKNILNLRCSGFVVIRVG